MFRQIPATQRLIVAGRSGLILIRSGRDLTLILGANAAHSWSWTAPILPRIEGALPSPCGGICCGSGRRWCQQMNHDLIGFRSQQCVAKIKINIF